MQLAIKRCIQRNLCGSKKYKIVTQGKKIRNCRELKSITYSSRLLFNRFKNANLFFP